MRILLRHALCAAVAAACAAPAAAETALARYGFTAGWATFGLALPQGAARDGVQIGALPTQTDVKVRWPDGSIRFAVVSSKVPSPGAYDLHGGSAGAGSLTAAAPPVSVTLTIAGRPYVAQLPAARSDFWLQGPLVSESRAVVAPGDHPFLRVIFDVRSFARGGHRVDVTVENTLDVAAADEITYDVAIAIGDQTVFRQANVAHKYLSRWRKVFLTGAAESLVTFDTAPFVAARALPAYLTTIAQTPRVLTGGGASGTGFGILAFGDLTVPMNAHSGRPELAPYPDWTARFLVHKSAPHRDYVLRHGELAGSWGIHVRNVDGSMPSIDARGNGYYWLDPRWRDNGFTGPQGHLEHRAEPGDIAHQPSLAFVPYLITGDRFFADEVAFWANFCLIGSFSSDDNRKGAQGLLFGNEVRGIGWGLRNLGDAAAYLPDASPMKAYLAAKVMNNLTYLDQYATSFYSGPLQTLFPKRRPEDGNPPYDKFMWISLWEQSYVAWAIDRVMQHGQVTQFDFATAGATLRNRIARLQLNLFTHPQWPRDPDREAPYLVAAGWWAPDRRIIYFQTFAEMAAATFSVPTVAKPDFVRPFEGYYGPEARLLLFICDGLGDAKAAEAIARLMADETGHVTMADDLNARSGWAIARESVNPRAGAFVTSAPRPTAMQEARRP